MGKIIAAGLLMLTVIGLNLAFWGFIVWAIYKLVIHLTGAV